MNNNYVQAVTIPNLPKGTIFEYLDVQYEVTHLPIDGSILNKTANRTCHWGDLLYFDDVVNVMNPTDCFKFIYY